jgi:hypothetical protein
MRVYEPFVIPRGIAARQVDFSARVFRLRAVNCISLLSSRHHIGFAAGFVCCGIKVVQKSRISLTSVIETKE